MGEAKRRRQLDPTWGQEIWTVDRKMLDQTMKRLEQYRQDPASFNDRPDLLEQLELLDRLSP